MSFAARATFLALQISWSGLLIALAPLTLSAQDTTGWQLVWSDEFNGSANAPPDRTKWNYDIGTGPIPGWGNNELETYTDSTDNAFQDGNGNLVIRALNTSNGYTSSRIKSQNKFSFTYGIVTARIKIPYAQGIWPAFWMLGATYPTVPWPDCGEIDIMENFGVHNGDASVNHGTLHGPGDTGVGITGSYTLPNGQKLSDDFHVFSIEWTPLGVAFFVDGNLYSNITSALMPSKWQSTLRNSFFMILNVAVGGAPAPVGAPDAFTSFPQQMLVDYIKVYQLAPVTTTKILPEFVFGGGWYSALYFTNTSLNSASVQLNFFAEDGTPLRVPPAGGSSTSINLGARATALVEAPNIGSLNVGYVSASMPDAVTGYGLFRLSVPGQADQEAVIPLSSSSATTSTLIWDDTNVVTAVAIVNPSAVATTVSITLWDKSGQNIVGASSVILPPNGHTAVVLRNLPGLGGMAGLQGSADFSVTSGNVAVLGLRFKSPAFTSIPTAYR